MNLMAVIPIQYRILAIALLAAACCAFGWVRGAAHVQAEWDAKEGARAAAVAKAYQGRIDSNKADAAKQSVINNNLSKVKDEEIARLTARIQSAGRLRVGPAICGGPAAPAETPSAAGGDSADPSGRLVQPGAGRDPDAQVEIREDADRDLKALKLAVEMDLASGRACQAFVRENGLQP